MVWPSNKVPASFKTAGMNQEHWDLLNELCVGPDGIAVGGYAKSYNFLMNIKDMPLSSLSKAQRKWLDDIIEQLSIPLEIRKVARGNA